MPGSFDSMWRALKRAHQAEPRLLAVSLALSLAAAVPDALLALWLMVLAQGHALLACVGFAFSVVGTWFLRVVSDRAQRRFRDRVAAALEAHVARLQASVVTIAHQERPELLNRLSMLRNQVFVLDHMYASLFSTLGWLLRLAVTIALLGTIHPVLLLLAVFAAPVALMSNWRPAVERAVEENAAPDSRLARHLFVLATTASPAKEIRVLRMRDRLAAERREVWERWYAPIARTRWTTAWWNMAVWALFAAAYIAAVVFTANLPGRGPGAILLVLAAGARLSAYVGAAVGEIGFLRGFWLDGSRRLAWLEDYAAAQLESANLAPPAKLRTGVRFENVSFAYPGTSRNVLEHINLEFKPGSVVAIVGENGAGKSTLVKLLARMYSPGEGRITVDGTDLASIHAPAWRERLAGAFQDFCRFELLAAETVGVGDVPRMAEPAALASAVARAGADDVIEHLPARFATQLGASWPAGVDLSFGQWQKLALARGFMRAAPLVLLLDEPTAALDAETEHALFERFAGAARAGGDTGQITLLVSHRFSTVRMADHIVVLSGAAVAESGTHGELMARDGLYAELYRIQAASYR